MIKINTTFSTTFLENKRNVPRTVLMRQRLANHISVVSRSPEPFATKKFAANIRVGVKEHLHYSLPVGEVAISALWTSPAFTLRAHLQGVLAKRK